LLLDCGIARGPKPAVDSESHFLGCTSATDCGGITGATCAGGWCVDVETGERIGMNALGAGNWDALPPGSSADDLAGNGAELAGIDPGVSLPEASVSAGVNPPPELPRCYTSSGAAAPPFKSQAELDPLVDCESIYGDLEITFDADLRVLHALRSLVGTLYIHPLARQLSSLAGLENLESVSGDLRLEGVSTLEPLARLQAVGTTPGRGLFLAQSRGLRDLSGLERLTSLRNLSIYDLPDLVSLDGLSLPPAGMESLTLQKLPGLATLPTFSAELVTLEETAFTSLAPLQAAAIGELVVRNNPLLVDATVYTVERLSLQGNARLTTLALPAQVRPLDRLELVGNPALQSIVSAEDLTSLDELSVRDNPALQTINLPWLQSLNTFQVLRNPSLTTIDLPLLVQEVQDLTVVSNPNLSMRSIFSITGRARRYKLAGNQGDPLFLDPCPYVRDTFCDEPPIDSICAPGTDRYDCGER
jgi:hypothetical protein